MTTADEARKIIAKARQTNVIRSSIPGASAVAELPELQCSKDGIRSPAHYRELLEIIERDHAEQWNRLAKEHTELRVNHLKLEKDYARIVVEIRQERDENARLKKRLILATEMPTCPPEGPPGGAGIPIAPTIPAEPITETVLPGEVTETHLLGP